MSKDRTWYIEARVGSENYRGSLVHFIDDRRGTDGAYLNVPAEQKMTEVLAALATSQAAHLAEIEAHKWNKKRAGRLESFAREFVEEPCQYGDNCPDNAGTRHGRCVPCNARRVLGEKGEHHG